MWREGCQLEVCLFNDRRWYSFLSVFSSRNVGIRYNELYFYILRGHHLYKVKESVVLKNLFYSEIRNIPCKIQFVGREWLDSCINIGFKFEDCKDLVTRYMQVISKI